jgi:hypothetical protein
MSLLRKFSTRHIHSRPSPLVLALAFSRRSCRRTAAAATQPPLRRAAMSSTATGTTQTRAPAIAGPDILRLFPDVNPALVGAGPAAASGDDALEGYDEEQVRLMDEVCIVIDYDDKPVGSGSKKICAFFPPSLSCPPSRGTRGSLTSRS